MGEQQPEVEWQDKNAIEMNKLTPQTDVYIQKMMHYLVCPKINTAIGSYIRTTEK